MLKTFVSFILSLTCILLASAQEPDILWTQYYNILGDECGSALILSDDGNIVMSGSSLGYNTGECIILKTDPSGNVIWTTIYGYDYQDAVGDVIQINTGEYIATGHFSFESSYNFRVGLAKIAQDGDLIWSRILDIEDYVQESGGSVCQTDDGGFIITGNCYSNGSHNIFIIKTDTSGIEEWQQTYVFSEDDYAYEIELCSDSGYVITGMSYNTANSSQDALLFKVDMNGNLLWSQYFGGDDDDCGYSLEKTVDGGYVLAGYNSSDVTGRGVYLLKTDSEGNELWSEIYQHATYCWGTCIKTTEDGGFIIGGTSSDVSQYVGSFRAIRTDDQGNELWTQTVYNSGGDDCQSVCINSDGGYLMFGYTSVIIQRDFYLVCLDSDPIQTGVSLSVIPESTPVQIPPEGGSFTYSVEITNVDSNDYNIDVWCDITFPAGMVLPVFTRENIPFPSGSEISRDNLIQSVPGGTMPGIYQYEVHVMNHDNWQMLAEDGFAFEKMSGEALSNESCSWALSGWEDNTKSSPILVSREISLFSATPNPFNNSTQLSYVIEKAGNTWIAVYDIMGREIETLVDGYRTPGQYTSNFDASTLASGVYFARIESVSSCVIQKLLLIK